MMKTYLNSAQKNQVSFMAAMLAMLMEFDQNDTLSKTEKTSLKYVTTYLIKHGNTLVKRREKINEKRNIVSRETVG